eukprot:gene4237-7574_t
MTIRSNSPSGYSFLAITGDSSGKENFTNAVVVATTTIGSQYKYLEYIGGENVTSSVLFTNKSRPNVGAIVGRSISRLRPLYFPNDYVVTIAIYQEVLTQELPSKFSNRTNFKLFVGSNYDQKPSFSSNYQLPVLDQLEVMPFSVDQNSYCYIPGIRRWSSFHVSIFIIELSFYFLVFLLCIVIYLFKLQPFYSRGLSPILGTMAQFFAVFEQLYVFTLNVEDISKYYCLFTSLFHFVGSQMALILIPLYLLRYIGILFFSKLKMVYYENIQNQNKSKPKSKFIVLIFKLIQNPIFNLLFIFCFWLFLNILYITIYLISISNGDITNGCLNVSNIMGYITIGLTVIIILIWISIYLLDLILIVPEIISFKPFKFKFLNLFHIFWKKDPLSFRIENLIGSILIFIYLIVSIIFTFVDIESNRIAFVLINSFQFHLLFIYQVVFVLVITLSQLLRKLICTRKQKKDEIDIILLDEEVGYPLFLNYSIDEFSSENVLIYKHIKKYEKTKDFDERKQIAQDIVQTYLGFSSPLEVNVNGKTRNLVKARFEEGKFENDMFDECLLQIRYNLFDTYSRFQSSPDFVFYSNQQHFKKEMNLIEK